MAILRRLLTFFIGASFYPTIRGFAQGHPSSHIGKNVGHFGVEYVNSVFVRQFGNGPVLSGNSLTLKPQEMSPDVDLPKQPLIPQFDIAPIPGNHARKQMPSVRKQQHSIHPAVKNTHHGKNIPFSTSVQLAPKASKIPFPVAPLPSKVSPTTPQKPLPPISKAATPTVQEEPPVDGGTVVIDKPIDPALIPSNSLLPKSPVDINHPGSESINIVPFVGGVRDMGLDGIRTPRVSLPPPSLQPLAAPPPPVPAPVPIPAPPVVHGSQASFQGRFSAGLQPGVPVNLIGESLNNGIVNGGMNTGFINGAGPNVVLSAIPFGSVRAFDGIIDNSLPFDTRIGSNPFAVSEGTNILEPSVNNLDLPLGPNNFETQFVANDLEAQFGSIGFVQQNGQTDLPVQFEMNNLESQFVSINELPGQFLSGPDPISPEGFGESRFNSRFISNDNFFPFQPPMGSPIPPFSLTSFPQENIFADSTENNFLGFGQIDFGQFNSDGFTLGGLGPNVETPGMLGSQIIGPQVLDGPNVIGVAGDTLNINSFVGGL